MAGRGPQSFKKRQKEQQRKEKKQEKLAKRQERKRLSESGEVVPDDSIAEMSTAEELARELAMSGREGEGF